MSHDALMGDEESNNFYDFSVNSDAESEPITDNHSQPLQYSTEKEQTPENCLLTLCKRELTDEGFQTDIADYHNTNFLLPSSFWATFWTGRRRLKKGWTDDFVEYFEKVSCYECCILSFNFHRCNAPGSNCVAYFYAKAKCKNTYCTSYRFEVTEPIDKPFKDTEVKVKCNKQIRHNKNEIHRRFFKGRRRDKLMEESELEAPSVITALKIQEVPERILKAGNRDDAPSLAIVQKISSEREKRKDLDPHPKIHLEKLAKLYRESPKWNGKIVSGYIQESFGTILFTEKQIRYLLSLKPKKNVFCYLNATGSIVSSLSNKPLYYYALVLPGSADYGPMPVAEFLSDTHSVPQITWFLSSFNHAVHQITSRKVIIKKIETDFSLALIISVIKSFNSMSLSRYLHIMDNILKTESNELPKLTLVHVCSSHMLKTVIRKCHVLFQNSQQRVLSKILMTKLIHSCTLDAAALHFEMIVVIFGLRKEVPVLNEYLEILEHRVSNENSQKDSLFDAEDGVNTTLKYDLESSSENQQHNNMDARKESPFYIFFKRIYDSCTKKFSQDGSGDSQTNKYSTDNIYYSEQFMDYLLTYILPYFPLWSAVILCQLDLLRDSNATVENYFKIIKAIVFRNKLRILAPRFVAKMKKLLHGWLLERKYSLNTTRQESTVRKQTASTNPELSAEQWKPVKSKKRKENKYFPPEKKIKRTDTPNDIVIRDETVSINPANTPPKKATSNNECRLSFSHFTKDVEERFFSDSLCYPPDFPNYSINFGGIPLTRKELNSLRPDTWLDGEIINSFFLAIEEIAHRNELKLLSFDSYFAEKLMACEKSTCFANWANRVEPPKFDVWLIPILKNNNHWTLLVILLKHRTMLYLDSYHNPPPKNLINKICTFISSFRIARQEKLTQWNKWVLSVPDDTPIQRTANGHDGGNCGVHICIWAYIIASSSLSFFKEESMNTARKGITQLLVNFPITRKILERPKTHDLLISSYDTVANNANYISAITVSNKPPLFDTTAEFCAEINNLTRIYNDD